MKSLGNSVADVFAGTETIIHLREDVDLDEKALKAAFKKHSVKFGGVEKNADYLL